MMAFLFNYERGPKCEGVTGVEERLMFNICQTEDVEGGGKRKIAGGTPSLSLKPKTSDAKTLPKQQAQVLPFSLAHQQ